MFLAGNSLIREQIKNAVFIDEMHPFHLQTHEMAAEFAIFFALAGFHTKQIGIRAVGTFAERHANLWDCKATGTADCEEVFARLIVLAARQVFVLLKKSEYPAAHEDMRVRIMVGLNLFEAFIGPIDTVSAINHVISGVEARLQEII